MPFRMEDLPVEMGGFVYGTIIHAKAIWRKSGGSASLLNKAQILECMNPPPRLLQSKSIQRA